MAGQSENTNKDLQIVFSIKNTTSDKKEQHDTKILRDIVNLEDIRILRKPGKFEIIFSLHVLKSTSKFLFFYLMEQS